MRMNIYISCVKNTNRVVRFFLKVIQMNRIKWASFLSIIFVIFHSIIGLQKAGSLLNSRVWVKVYPTSDNSSRENWNTISRGIMFIKINCYQGLICINNIIRLLMINLLLCTLPHWIPEFLSIFVFEKRCFLVYQNSWTIKKAKCILVIWFSNGR